MTEKITEKTTEKTPKLNPSRVDLRDLDKNIFRPFNSKPQALEIDTAITPDVVTYTIKGKEDDIDEDGYPVLWDAEYQTGSDTSIVKAEELDEAFAKKSNNGKRNRYWVKQDSSGHFYNPNGLYSTPGHHNKDIKRAGGLQWKFREVSLREFELYLSFLKSGNDAHRLNAERVSK